MPPWGRRGRRILAGGVLGAVVVLQRELRSHRRIAPPSGLRAFEDAPCFRVDHGLDDGGREPRREPGAPGG